MCHHSPSDRSERPPESRTPPQTPPQPDTDPEAARRFELWVNEPIEPCMIVRRFAALYQRITFAVPGLSEAQMLHFACAYARHNGVRLCFCPNRRWSYWIEPGGIPPKPVETREIFANRPRGGFWLEEMRINRIDGELLLAPRNPESSSQNPEGHR